MNRGLFALIASCCMTLPLTATAQEQLSLDEYFKGTGLEGQINAQASDFQPINAPVPAVQQSNFVPPGLSPRNPLPAAPMTNLSNRPVYQAPAPSVGTGMPLNPPGPLSSSTLVPSGMGRSQIDPLTGLPLEMTHFGLGKSPRDMGMFAPPTLDGSLGNQLLPPVPSSSWNGPTPAIPQQNWAAFPTQQQQFNQSGIAQVGHTGPIVFAGGIEPLAPGETINAGGLPTNVPLPDQVALNEPLLPALQDFGDLSQNLLEGMKTEPYDRSMDDLCISRKGYVVLEHWGWHAAALAGRRNSFGMTNVQASFTLSFPQLVDGFMVRPQFGWHQLSGPSKTDMPAQVFDVMVEGSWRQQITDRAFVRVAGTAGLYTDFDQSNLTDGVRVSGMALGTYEVNDDLQLVLGAAVINLQNRRVLPIAGVVYHPNDDIRMELMFPEGRIAQRIDPGRDYDRWIYVSGAFFGRTWNVARSSGATENVTYSDWRVGLGIESHMQTRAVWYVELGASLGRELEYESHLGDYNPAATGYLRGGIYY